MESRPLSCFGMERSYRPFHRSRPGYVGPEKGERREGLRNGMSDEGSVRVESRYLNGKGDGRWICKCNDRGTDRVYGPKTCLRGGISPEGPGDPETGIMR